VAHVRLRSSLRRSLPVPVAVDVYIEGRRRRFTEASLLDVRGTLKRLTQQMPEHRLCQLEPSSGTGLIEEFLQHHWGAAAGRTYNKNLSNLRAFFKWQVIHSNMRGDPTLAIERAKVRAVHRTTFSVEQVNRIIGSQPETRDRVALRLPLYFGLRKGALARVQFEHFDQAHRRLTIFTKGEKIHTVPLNHGGFWQELNQLARTAKPHHFLLCKRKTYPVEFEPVTRKALRFKVAEFPDLPLGYHAIHNWWYRCLERAGIVAKGVTSGERLHKARHTAGQMVVDITGGNLKAAQKLLGHEDIALTGNTYVGWDIGQLGGTMDAVLERMA
jgi:site-specific recombinase XerD